MSEVAERQRKPRSDVHDRRAAGTALGLLSALWLAHAGSNLAWLKMDTRPPFWDMAGHAITAIHLSQLPFRTDLAQALQEWFTSSVYPPLLAWISTPLGVLFWPTSDVLAGVLSLFLGVLMLSTYGIASRFGGRRAGLLAAFIVSMYPLVYGLERHYLIDVPLMAMVALSIWLLLHTERFERRGVCVAYGLSLGFGMLTKEAFAIFAAGPCLVVILFALPERSRRKLLNLALALAACALVAGPWYVVNLLPKLEFLGRMPVYALAEGDPAIASLGAWTYYLRAFVTDQVLLPLALLFVAMLVPWLLARRSRYEIAFLLAGWIVLPYLAASAFINKDARYTMPYLPAVAIITALGLVRLRPRAVRVGLSVALVFYAAVQFLGLSWGLSSRLPAGLLPAQVSVQVGSASLPIYAEHVHIASPPVGGDWQAQRVLQTVMDTSVARSQTAPLKLAVLPDAPGFEQNVFRYYALIERMPIEVVNVTGVVEIADARQQVLSSDYAVTKTGDLGPAWSIQQSAQFTAALDDPASDLGRQFALVGEFGLPDGSVARLYQHVP
jgi:4-amino-4-deoxy-L-arabinose transferase-like glycosyltransferase